MTILSKFKRPDAYTRAGSHTSGKDHCNRRASDFSLENQLFNDLKTMRDPGILRP